MSKNMTADTLSAGYSLDQYRILKVMGGGGFSFVYLAEDTESGEQLVIKEYMPRKLSTRDEQGDVVLRGDEFREQFAHGRRLFFAEATFLANIGHPNIVDVVNFFRANGTVYMVMRYEEGITLHDYIKRHKKPLDEAMMTKVFYPLLDGFKMIHEKGMLHLDMKPGNVYLRKGYRPMLLDFGAIHEMKQTRQYQPGQVMTPGFCPFEQLNKGGYVGPWSDIYSIGASIRSCIEGHAPPRAEDRHMQDKMKPAAEQFKRRYSQGLLQAIDWAMEVDPTLRPQNIDEFYMALKQQIDEPPTLTQQFLGRFSGLMPKKR